MVDGFSEDDTRGRADRGRLIAIGVVLPAGLWVWLEVVSIVLGGSDPLILVELAVGRDILSQILRALFAVGVAVVAVRFLRVSSPLDWIGVRRPVGWEWGYIFFGVILMIVSALVSTILIQNALGLERTTAGPMLSEAVLWSRIVTLLIIVGPAEELVFRGIIQRSLRDAMGAWPSILVAGVLFGFAHIEFSALAPGDILWLVALSILGVILGWMYERTNNLVIPALVHGGFNSITTALPLLLG